MSYTLIGPSLYVDDRGRLFEKEANDQYTRLQSKETDAEDRYVERNLKKEANS